jgi:redox-sensitive bicupin YhaK (pirin superfamily)
MNDSENDFANDFESIETIVVPRSRDLGDQFMVRRALPSKERRMVGPFVFLDEMGPTIFEAGRGLDVRPHPHIGLATVTYLMRGEILHRDSLGYVQPIRPGDVNWMTAGSGIVHSERTAPEIRTHESSLFGLQSWVALPKKYEEITPSFKHTGAAELPVEEGEGIHARIIAGEFFSRRSPFDTLSDLFYVDVQLQPNAVLNIPPVHDEQAIYIVEGEVFIASDGIFPAGQLIVLKPGLFITVKNTGTKPARIMLLGGEPMDGPRHISWNFVSSSQERIEQAKQDWREQKFARVPEETEYIPLPDYLNTKSI